ncbi:radial spoke head protein 4-like protein a [Plakobranchus ocellatus]|uniref:Radial spoke head protein 4-like protein a n=1 Tax=Plakobranchus ocellatus TaxID=259542 RepID=A0AAV4BNG6_9GAST|nr:radial spoke head protein 4-like protein a [Plakobranchus ocellatus]
MASMEKQIKGGTIQKCHEGSVGNEKYLVIPFGAGGSVDSGFALRSADLLWRIGIPQPAPRPDGRKLTLATMSPERNVMAREGDRFDQRQQTGNEAEGGDLQDEEEELDDVLHELNLNEAERAVLHAKLELLRASDESGISLYDHLAELLAEILTDSSPGQAVDNLERISQRLKVTRVTSAGSARSRTDGGIGPGLGSGIEMTPLPVERDPTFVGELAMLKRLKVTRVTSAGSARSRTDGGIGPGLGSGIEMTPLPVERDPTFVGELAMLKTIGRERMQTTRPYVPTDADLERLAILPDMMRQCHMFNMAGFGLPASDYARLALAMRELVFDWPLKSIRFWGKILGLNKDYYIVETEFQDGDYESEAGSDDGKIDGRKSGVASQQSDTLSKDISFAEGEVDIPPAYKPPVSIPSEESGTGTNAKVYFVCNEPGLTWTRLPHVTPAQIVAARQIRHYFTGHLDHVHATFPPFPGNEANYLRAQIARITSSTSVSPIGYFKFDEEGEEEEEHEESRDTCIRDEDFDGVSPRDLSDSGLGFWVHHSNYILPQGRTVWFNPVLARRRENEGAEDADGGEDEDDEDEEERKEPDEPEPEIPQPLLIPLSEDVDVGASPGWLTRLTSQFVPEHSPVAVISVTWPGAVTVAIDKGKFFENLYIGFGQKQLDSTFDPATPEEPQMEFPIGPEVTEKDDPTPGEEAAIKAALREQEEWELLRGKGRGENDEDDEEDDDDDEHDEGDDEDVEDYDDNDDDY